MLPLLLFFAECSQRIITLTTHMQFNENRSWQVQQSSYSKPVQNTA